MLLHVGEGYGRRGPTSASRDVPPLSHLIRDERPIYEGPVYPSSGFHGAYWGRWPRNDEVWLTPHGFDLRVRSRRFAKLTFSLTSLLFARASGATPWKDRKCEESHRDEKSWRLESKVLTATQVLGD